jgi:hypothetical protein
MAAEEAALRAEYDTDTFSNDFMRRQFHPALAGLAARRTAIYAAIAAACGRISDEWTRTIAFFSPHAIAQRLTRPPLPPVKYIIAIFKAQWVGVTTAEHNLLLNCKPRHFPTYKQWLSRFKDLVVLTSSEPPLTREKLCEHFMSLLLEKYGTDIHNYVKSHYTSLDPTTRTVLQLYAPASMYHRDHLEAAETAPRRSLTPEPAFRRSSTPEPSTRHPSNSTPTRPRPDQSPSRGRTPYPSSGNRLGVSFAANNIDYYSPPPRERQRHHHEPPAPQQYYYHQDPPEPHHAYAVTSSTTKPAVFCNTCQAYHANGLCYYDTEPSRTPDWWAPEALPTARLVKYLTTCQAAGWVPKLPQPKSTGDARGPIPRPIPVSSATAQRPQSTRNTISTTAQGRGARAPAYHNQPPPEQLQRQQQREERHASHHFAYEEPQFETNFNVMVLDAEINATLRSHVRAAEAEAAQAARSAAGPPPTAEAEPPMQRRRLAASPPREKEAVRSAVPEPRLRREPPPVGFTADELARGLLPSQLPPLQNTHLAAARMGAVQRAQALPLSTGVVPAAARLQKGVGGTVGVQLQQLVNFAGLGEYFKEPLPLLVAGVGTEQYAVDLSQVTVLMGVGQAAKIFGGVGGGVQAHVAEAEVAVKEEEGWGGGVQAHVS